MTDKSKDGGAAYSDSICCAACHKALIVGDPVLTTEDGDVYHLDCLEPLAIKLKKAFNR